MKLVRYGDCGAERAGLIDAQGVLRDLSMLLPDIGPAQLGPRTLSALAAIDAARLPAVGPGTRLACPVAGIGKIVCVGLNYADHTKESPYEQPDYPTLFLRTATSLNGHDAVVERPLVSDSLDFEGEMVVVLGQGGRHIPKERALDCVFGYAVGNEISVREYQFKSPQWTVGKNFDGTAPWGPYLVTADELPPGGRGLRLQTRLNGETMQSADTADMLFDVATVISTLSEAITLQPGDVIFSGTPAGVGFGRNPKLYMKDGDRVEVEIERIGLLRNTIRDAQRR